MTDITPRAADLTDILSGRKQSSTLVYRTQRKTPYRSLSKGLSCGGC